MNNTYLEIVIILVLIAFNGFFSLSELSIIASRKSKLKQMIEHGHRTASRALKLKSRPESFLATVQVGITFVGVLSGAVAGATIADSLTPYIAQLPVEIISKSAYAISFVLVVAIITFLAIVWGELIPKYLALSKPESIASYIARPMSWFTKLTFFIVKILNWSAKFFLSLIGLKKIPERSSITEDEINLIIAEGREKGVFDATEQELIHSVFDFSDTTARQAMTPRTDIIAIDIEEEKDGILSLIGKYGFSKYPVYEETIDKITGILHTKDIVKMLHHSMLFILKDIIRKPLYIPDSMKLSVLLRTFQQKKVQAAVVLDEFGGTAGIITMDDLLEEIVGELRDEHDTEQKEFVRETETVAFASASLRVDELNDGFNTNLPEDGPDTLGGLVFEYLERPASKGEDITIHNIKFRVLELKGNRIIRFRVEKL